MLEAISARFEVSVVSVVAGRWANCVPKRLAPALNADLLAVLERFEQRRQA
jgi:hypothetical protein